MAPASFISRFLKHPCSPPPSLSGGLASSLCTPMHRSITLNHPDNSIQRGNWHHRLLIGLIGDQQMIGPVSVLVGDVYHRVCALWRRRLSSTTVFNDDHFCNWHIEQLENELQTTRNQPYCVYSGIGCGVMARKSCNHHILTVDAETFLHTLDFQ